jgi:hypothetical protein
MLWGRGADNVAKEICVWSKSGRQYRKTTKAVLGYEPAVLYTHNNKKTKTAKHINIRFYVVKEKIKDQTISLEHISTKKMIAETLMKGLSPSVFR